jgi:hypothetical protein
MFALVAVVAVVVLDCKHHQGQHKVVGRELRHPLLVLA